ncbi:MAG: hypothetical protein IK115_07570 [Lachnospiraceae bacterium]|nr:hypothetical protein [Lachnospiraceae bacterium]
MKEIKAHPILLSVLGIACIHYTGLGLATVVILLAFLICDVAVETKSNVCQWALLEAVFSIVLSAVGYVDRFWNWFWGFFSEDYYETYILMTGKMDIVGYVSTALSVIFFVLFVTTLLKVAKGGRIKLPFVGAFVEKFFYPGAQPQMQQMQQMQQPQQFQGQMPQQQFQQGQAPMNNNGQWQ